ncbi:MAG: hypothetical protein AAF206_04215, partial [Bacteroidota bacterium]
QILEGYSISAGLDYPGIGPVLREALLDEIDLYFMAWTKEQAAKFAEWNLGYAHPDVLDTAIEFSPEEEEMAFQSILCHKSQYTAADMQDWIAKEQKDTTNRLYFRKAVVSQILQDGF